MAHGFLLAAAVLVGSVAAAFYFLYNESNTFESYGNGGYSSGRGSSSSSSSRGGYSSNRNSSSNRDEKPQTSGTFVSGYDTAPDVTDRRRKKKREDRTCAICLESLESIGLVSKTLLCSHIFHLDCINTWSEEKHECPVCRRVM